MAFKLHKNFICDIQSSCNCGNRARDLKTCLICKDDVDIRSLVRIELDLIYVSRIFGIPIENSEISSLAKL